MNINTNKNNMYSNIGLDNNVNDPELFTRDEENSPFSNYNPVTETYETSLNTGRMPNLGPNLKYPQFELFQENHRGPETNFNDSLQGIVESSIIAKVFFSGKNINNIQQKIINGVFEGSGGKINIGRQADTELKTIMRSIFLEYSQNLDCHIQEQIIELNKRVLAYCIPNVLTGAIGHINYLNELDRPIQLMPAPIHTNIAGENSLENNPMI